MHRNRGAGEDIRELRFAVTLRWLFVVDRRDTRSGHHRWPPSKRKRFRE